MHPTSPATTTTTTSVITTSVTTTTTIAAMPTVRVAEARASLLDLPNEMLFQIAVHLLKDGYPVFFRALSNFALVSRRSAEVMEEISLRVHRMHKSCSTDSIWLWTRLQSFVNEQVRDGRDARLAVSAGLDRLLRPGMDLVPGAGEMLDTILSARHAALPCSTITFDVPEIVSQSIRTLPLPAYVTSASYHPYMANRQSSEETQLCRRIGKFLHQNAQVKERPEIFLVMRHGNSIEDDDTLRSLAGAAVKYGKAFLKVEFSNRPIHQAAALLEALASGKVISIDLNCRSTDDDVSKELIQAIRKADSLQHLRIHCLAGVYSGGQPAWADLLPELNGHASLRKLTVLHWGAAEDTREHLENLPDCPKLETVEFRLCVDVAEEVDEESRKMRELIDAVRRADEDKFSVTFVVGSAYPGNVQL